jgi:hypothetical protein
VNDPLTDFDAQLPAIPEVDDKTKDLSAVRFGAQVDRRVARAKATDEAFAREEANEAALFRGLHEEIRRLAGERAGKRAEFADLVQKASAAIVTLYSGLLGLVYVAGNPLPVRAVYAAVFLGLAVVLSTAYVAFLTQPKGTPIRHPGGGSARENVLAQTQTLVEWVSNGILHRATFLRVSVLALALGLMFLPAAFVTVGQPSAAAETQALTLTPTWPPQPQLDEAQIALFQKQLDEIAALRNAQASAVRTHDPETERLTGTAFGLAVIVLLAFGIFDARGARSDQLIPPTPPKEMTKRPSLIRRLLSGWLVFSVAMAGLLILVTALADYVLNLFPPGHDFFPTFAGALMAVTFGAMLARWNMEATS